MKRSAFTLIAFLLLVDARRGTAADDITLRDVAGKAHTPLKLGDKKAVCLIFITHDCPIANTFAPEITRISETYEAKGIAVYLVHVDRDLSAEKAAAHAKEYKLSGPVLLDKELALAKKSGATVTPEAAVLSDDGTLLYRGRINDLYVAFGKKRHEATQHDLRAALDAIVAGKAITIPRTEAIGCFIPGQEPQKDGKKP